MLWLILGLFVVSFVGLAVIGAHWRRWGFADEMNKLHEATDAVKVEMGAALLPAFRKMIDGAAKITR